MPRLISITNFSTITAPYKIEITYLNKLYVSIISTQSEISDLRLICLIISQYKTFIVPLRIIITHIHIISRIARQRPAIILITEQRVILLRLRYPPSGRTRIMHSFNGSRPGTGYRIGDLTREPILACRRFIGSQDSDMPSDNWLVRCMTD